MTEPLKSMVRGWYPTDSGMEETDLENGLADFVRIADYKAVVEQLALERQISHDRRVALLRFDEAECEDRKRIGVLERVLLSVYEQLEVAKDVIEDSGVDGPTFTLESLKNITDAATKTFTAKLAFLKAKR